MFKPGDRVRKIIFGKNFPYAELYGTVGDIKPIIREGKTFHYVHVDGDPPKSYSMWPEGDFTLANGLEIVFDFLETKK